MVNNFVCGEDLSRTGKSSGLNAKVPDGDKLP